MKSIVTNDVLESYIHCKYKSYLKLTGQSGIKSDYENLRIKLRCELKHNALSKIYKKADAEKIISDVALEASILGRELLFILNASVKDDCFSFILDGIKKVEIKQKGYSLYAPILFYEGSQIRKEQRLLLDLFATSLFKYQKIIPSYGIIYHGEECKQTTVRLNADSRKVRLIQLDLRKMSANEEVPKLILNGHCQICEFQSHCYKQASQEDNLSLIRGISEKEIKSFNRKGILTVTQLSHTFRPRRKRKHVKKEASYRYHALQALAIRDQKTYIFGNVQVPDSPVCIYLDIESDPEMDFVYLIGLVIVENGSEKRYSFWADSKAQETQIFEQFLNEVMKREEFIIFSYGTYERSFVKRMKKISGDKALVDRILNALVNTLSIIYSHIYFPSYSNGLKDIAKYLGFSWTELDASGIQSIVWRKKWEVSHDDIWRYKLLKYNIEDCLALRIVTETIRHISLNTKSSENGTYLDSPSHLSVGFIEDVEKLSDYQKWGRIDFVQPEFEFINERSYFDYQREKVYVRNSKTINKAITTKIPSPNRSLSASKKIVIAASQCPICESENIISNVEKKTRAQEPRLKRAFDIIFTPTGIRRRVLEYKTSVYQCLNCHQEFIPTEYQRLDRHFHGLKSWVVFQHVEYGTNLQALSNMLEEFFGVRVAYTEVHTLKSLMAGYYEKTYKKLLENIIAGELLHVDETEINFRNQKGYVWVFTNLEEVFYLYRPSREGEFLHELLANFKGVLVSDFYSAYDSIKCPQQRCLIHLIRDINQELLNNPFDEDLKMITQSFGVLLREIITTIDDYGLKKKHLMRHSLAVEEFFYSIGNRLTLSDAAEALRARLLKNRDKLFTFIQYSGVPWNNNNAEHAIKRFADYRTLYKGNITENGLKNYLVLLSIRQTCDYKGIDFLEFLLSKNQDIDAFSKRKNQKYQSSDIEIYPEKFIPSHLIYRHKNKESKVGYKAENHDLFLQAEPNNETQ